jgi:hypothetical protein
VYYRQIHPRRLSKDRNGEERNVIDNVQGDNGETPTSYHPHPTEYSTREIPGRKHWLALKQQIMGKLQHLTIHTRPNIALGKYRGENTGSH